MLFVCRLLLFVVYCLLLLFVVSEGSHSASWSHETSLTGLTRVTCTSMEEGVVENVASMFEKEG